MKRVFEKCVTTNPMKIAVLDYAGGSVDIFEIPEGEHIEWYLTEEKGYRLEEIHWMEAKCININI